MPKTITDSGRTLTLGAVEWSGSEAGHYTASATYTGTSSTRYATGYTVTASYKGQVSKTGCEVVTYTAIFGSEALEQMDEPAVSEVPELPDPAPVEAEAGARWPAVLGCAGGMAGLAAAALWAVQKWKARRI